MTIEEQIAQKRAEREAMSTKLDEIWTASKDAYKAYLDASKAWSQVWNADNDLKIQIKALEKML